jgi:hypothetical protein
MFLVGGIGAWTASGKPFASISTIDAEELRRRILIKALQQINRKGEQP